MRSPFIDRHEDIVPRSLRDLLATETASQATNTRPRTERRRRRQRRITTVRRAP